MNTLVSLDKTDFFVCLFAAFSSSLVNVECIVDFWKTIPFFSHWKTAKIQDYYSVSNFSGYKRIVHYILVVFS